MAWAELLVALTAPPEQQSEHKGEVVACLGPLCPGVTCVLGPPAQPSGEAQLGFASTRFCKGLSRHLPQGLLNLGGSLALLGAQR